MVNDAEKRFITQNRDIVATEIFTTVETFLSHFSFYAIAFTILCSSVCYRVVPNMVTNIFN